MEWDLQFVTIIVTVLLAGSGACWTIMTSVNKGLAETRKEAKEDIEKGFAEAKEEREKGFAEARREREKGFATAEKAREKGFAEAKDGRRQIRDEMNRRFDAVESRLARLEAPYFQRKSEDEGVPIGRVAEPLPAQYPRAGGRAEGPRSTRGRVEDEGRDESGEGPAESA